MKSTYKNFTPPSPEVESRIDEILGQLTLEEKIKLLGGQKEPNPADTTYPIEHAGIPALRFSDGPVGVHWFSKTSTTYPTPIALAASWDPEVAYRVGAAIGRDARARGIHVLLAPGVNIYRSPLCGRNFEYLGEDPCLTSKSVAGYIKGVQSQGVAATVKHYAVNFQEYDRNEVSSDVDERTLHEVYLPAFRAAVEAGVGALMTAYNLVNGIHASEHDYLINKVLKDDWGFDGVVMSDWVSVYNAENAANAGLDLEMPVTDYMNAENLLSAIREGRVSQAAIDDKIRRMLRLIICFGWMDNPQKDESIPLEDEANAEVALSAARAGCVLLKNEGNLLPINPKAGKKIAVIGSNADPAVIGGGGSTYNNPWRSVSVLDGVREIFGAKNVVYAQGLDTIRKEKAFPASVFHTPDGRDGILVEYFEGVEASGTPLYSAVEETIHHDWNWDPIPAGEKSLERGEFAVRWTGEIRPQVSGEHIFYLDLDGGEYTITLGDAIIAEGIRIDATCEVNLEAGRAYPLSILYTGGYSREDLGIAWSYRDCHVRLGWESRAALQIERREALKLAEESDAVIFCGGFNQKAEKEGLDRTFELPCEQSAFLAELAEANHNTVAVINAGGNVDMSAWVEKVGAILWVWYPGQEGGKAVAEVISGFVNPSGKLPVTFERKLADRSSFDSYHDEDNDKHVTLSDGIFTGYKHHDRTHVKPLFPFGFGLSYTTFAYENLSIEPGEGAVAVSASFDLVNTGEVTGEEIAQVYISDLESSLPRPEKELCGFAKVHLEAGERKSVTVPIPRRALQFYNPGLHAWISEPGEFEVLVGASAADIRLAGRFSR